MNSSFTKFFAILVCIYVLCILKSNGQAGIGLPYGFGVTPTSTNITGATTINLTVRPAAIQDEMDTLLTIPSAGTITFGGIVYNRFAVSTNGWLALVPSSAGLPLSNPFPPNPTNSLSTSAIGYPVIAPLWDDMSMASIQYNWTAPVLTVKWTGRWDKTNASLTNAFGVKIDGTTGICTFFYNNVAYTPSSPSASIGIAGICTGDFTAVNVTSATAALSDTVIEPNVTIRPNNVNYIFTPYNPHNNCSGTYIAKNLGTLNSTCTLSGNYSTVHATTSGSGMACAAGEVKDVWFSVIKPLGVTNVRVTTAPGTCQVLGGTTVEVRASCAGASLGCSTTGTTYPTFGEVDIARPCAAETLYVRVTGDGDAAGKFRICVIDNGGGSFNGNTCSAPTYICSLPYNQTGLTTLGAGNDYDSTNTVCHSLYARGEDYIFAYTPTVSQCVRVSVTSTGTNPGVFIYNNCPDSSGTGPTYCLGSAEGITGTVTINSVTLLAGTTYYIMVDNQIAGGNIPFDISVTSLGTANTYDNCATPINLGSISNGQSCVFQTYSTECSTPSAVGTVPVPSCINASAVPRTFIDGVTGDVWLRFTAAFSGIVQISTQQGSVNPTANAAMAVYTGTCGAFTQYACDYNSGPNGMPSLSIPITNGVTYYIRVWSENPESQGTFDICLQSACAPPNDLPCGAVLLSLGVITSGFNTCTGATSEPPNTAQCSAGGTINTVWYMTVVPASGQVHIRTHPLTLTDTQIQAFTFASGCTNAATTFVNRGCNDDGPGCSGGFSDFSDLNVTGLTPGETLYVAVDGFNSQTGSFEITVIDGTSLSFPPVYQQDCQGAQVLCSTSSVTVANPGFRNYGNICDRAGATGCWGVGERNSIWYQFTVDPALSGGTANLTFDILPASSADIDFLVWDITGQSTPCPSITSGALAPAACNTIASSSSTGLTTASPLPYAYSNAITFTGAPRTYIVLLNNIYSAANAGYTLNWGSTPISTAASTAIWTGLTDVLFSTSTNWGDCGGTPACGIDAIVNPTANGRQPNVIGSQGVKNITINAGATLTLAPGATLTVCGNFTNFGNLVCGAGSTIIFVGTTAQTITGNFTGANGFANLSVLKTANSVTLASNIDVKENFTTLSATSIFNIGGKYMKVGGNFTNNTSNTTFTGIGGSTVEFNGADNQFLNNINVAGITMNRVIMNKAGGKLYLNSANSSLNIDSVLTMTSGNIVTRSNAALQVFVKYGVSAAITGHNALSFIDGKLRRAVYTGTALTLPFSLDYPVGDSLSPGGYELANVTFTSGTVIPDIQGFFSPWPTSPPFGPVAIECNGATYNNHQLLDHGYWTFSKTNPTPFNGIYRLTMNNVGYTNNAGSGWTVAKADIAANPSLAASWSLIGQCSPSSTANVTQRVNINGTNPYSITTTLGSNIISTANTTSLSVGAAITGVGIPVGSVITTIPNATTFTISNQATASGTVTGSIGSTANSSTSFNHLYAIAVNSPPFLQANSIQTSSILCNGGQGVVQISATGGLGPYTGTGTFNVPAGAHNFTVTDSNGSSSTTSIVITEPAELIATATATPILCNGDLSTVAITANGGTAPYNGIGSFSVGAGTYSYVISDANGCSDTVSVIITEPNTLIASATATPIFCIGGTSTITVSASGGIAPYTGTGSYSVVAGTYSYTVVDANGCSVSTAPVTISAPAYGSYTSASINLGGNITISPSSAPVNYSLLSISVSSGFTGIVTIDSTTGIVNITNAAPAGIYTITVGGCLSQTFTLTVNTPACGGQGSFVSAPNVNVGSDPRGLTIGDFNNDGKQDLAIVNYGSATVSIRLGDGLGNFVSATDVNVGIIPTSVSVSDFNSDGKQDLAITKNGSATVAIRLGNGSGGFSAGTDVNVETNPWSVAIADFNGDGKQDLAVANNGSASVSIRLGDGLGSFSGTTNVSIGANPTSVVVADFNGDGMKDLAVTNYTTNMVSIRLGDGLGNFSGSTTVSVGSSPRWVTSGDFNSDGKADLAVANYGSSSVSIRQGDGLGGFSGTTNVSVGNNPFSVATGDFNSDNKQDLAVANQGSNTVSIRLGDGIGNFSGSNNMSIGSVPTSVAVGDYDADGKQDLAIANYNSANVSIYLGASNEINILSNGNIIAYGSSSVSIMNNTDFGSIGTCNQVSKIYTIQNTGNGPLVCSGINISGSNAAEFTVSGISFPATILAGNSTTFTISFSPLTNGTRSAIVHVMNDDCDEADYNFSVQGTALTSVIGNYPSASINAGGSIAITPTSVPTNTAVLNVSASAGFAGSLSADPLTGIVQVTNAQPAGIYTITIFVGQCAIKNFVLTVEPPSCMVVSILASPIQCYGGASTVTVTATGGTPPYSGTGSFSSVSGTFLFTVSDGGGCTVSNNITIPQSEALPLSATSTATPILCYGNTSQVTVIASGGTPPYAGTGIFTANAGTSSYTITDSIGCTETTVQTINQPLELIASTTQGEISCNGGTTIINVSASGGIAPYSGTGSFTVYSGAFTYTVTDANGCSSTISGAVTEPPMLTTNSSAGLILCNGGTTMVNVTASGGTLPYTGTGSYTVSAGPFSYTVTDANGCSSSTSGNISEPATLVTSASTGVILCNGGSTSIVVSATGGIPPYSGTGSFTATAGSYSYTVSDANGCSSNIAGTITEPTTLTAFSSADLVSCNTSSTTVTVTATGGTLPYSGTGLFSATIGTHTYSVTDANGCISSTAVTVESNNSPTINSISVSSGCVGDEIILTGIGFTGATAVVFNGTSATSYTILNSNTLAVTIPVGASSGPITVVSASGCIGSSNAFVVFCQTQFTINLTVFIQGYYIGSGMMQPVLLNQLIPGATSAETDTIQVEIYDATTFLLSGYAKALLMTDGTCTAMITGTNGNYYIAVRQRNSICTWSSAPVALSLSVPASYNFSTSLNQSFGYWMADNYSEGIYSLFSGDINQDEFIDANDYTSFDQDNANGLCCGYFATDLNGDGFVDGSDYPLFDTNNSMGVLSIHP